MEMKEKKIESVQRWKRKEKRKTKGKKQESKAANVLVVSEKVQMPVVWNSIYRKLILLQA